MIPGLECCQNNTGVEQGEEIAPLLPAAKQFVVFKELIVAPHQEIDPAFLNLLIDVLYAKLDQFLEDDIMARCSTEGEKRRSSVVLPAPGELRMYVRVPQSESLAWLYSKYDKGSTENSSRNRSSVSMRSEARMANGFL